MDPHKIRQKNFNHRLAAAVFGVVPGMAGRALVLFLAAGRAGGAPFGPGCRGGKAQERPGTPGASNMRKNNRKRWIELDLSFRNRDGSNE